MVNRRVAQFFTVNGMEPPLAAIEASSLGALLSIVRTGNFIAGVAAPILDHAQELGLARVPVEASFWRFKAGVAYRRDQTQPLIPELVCALREAMLPRDGARRPAASL